MPGDFFFATEAGVVTEHRVELAEVAHLAEVASLLRAAPVSLAGRLFNLKWIDEATRRALSEERQRPALSGLPKRFLPSFVAMLFCAIDKGSLSTRKAAKALGLTLSDLVGLVAEHGSAAPFEL